MARIRIVKNASGQALFNKKKAHEARMQAFDRGDLSFDALRDEDIFEIQHHHLLQCLEKATVSPSSLLILSRLIQEREFVEADVEFEGGRPTPPISEASSISNIRSKKRKRQFCCVKVDKEEEEEEETREQRVTFNQNLNQVSHLSL